MWFFFFSLLFFLPSLSFSQPTVTIGNSGPTINVGLGVSSAKYATLAAAITDFGSNVATLVVNTANFPPGTTPTIPSTMILKFENGGTLSCGSTTITINSDSSNWPMRQIFDSDCVDGSGNSRVLFSNNIYSHTIYSKWWGMVADGVTDERNLFYALEHACGSFPGGSTLILQTGSILFGSVVYARGENCHIKGESRTDTILVADSGQNYLMQNTVTYPLNKFEISNLTIKPGIIAGISLDGAYLNYLSIHDSDFDFTSSSGEGLSFQAAQGWDIYNNYFYGDGSGLGTAIALGRGSHYNDIYSNRMEYVKNGIKLDGGTAGEEPLIGNKIRNNYYDGGWLYLKPDIVGSGGTVTYGASNVVDTAQDFTGKTTRNIVALPLKQSSAGTITYFSPGNKIVNTNGSVDFVAANIKRGDFVFSPSLASYTKWSIVVSVEDADELWIEPWRSATTWKPTTAPASNTAYEVRGLVHGYINSLTGTTQANLGLFSAAWLDINGTTATPASGTPYRVLQSHPNYPILLEIGVSRTLIDGNFLRRGWSDQIGAQDSTETIIINNYMEDGRDVGITYNGARGIVKSNQAFHQGTSGISASSSDSIYEGNIVTDNGYTYTVSSVGSSAIMVFGDRNTFVNNGIYRISALQQYGISIRSGADANVLRDNVLHGQTADLYFENSGATNTTIGSNVFSTISDGGASGTIWRLSKDFTQANLPVGAPGSLIICTNCTADADCAPSGGGGGLAKIFSGTTWVCN